MFCNHTIGIIKDYDDENTEYPWLFIYASDKQEHEGMVKFDYCPRCGEKIN